MVVIGGSSGIGLSVAKTAAILGAEVIIASRDMNKLKQAQKEVGYDAAIHQLDASNPDELKKFFTKIGKFDHLHTPGATVHIGAFKSMSYKDEQASFNSKFWGQYYAAKYALQGIDTKGSITLYAGCWSQRPISGSAIPASINGAIEGLGRALAIELAPLRINVISPGIIDTPVFSSMTARERKSFFEATAKSLPVGRIGTPEEVAKTAVYLMTNNYTTGSTIYIDGGCTLK